MERTEVRLAGFGGQGIILAGYILGKASALFDGKHAVQTQAYGPEARGGACSAGVVISDEKLDYPLVATPDLLAVMSQEAYKVFSPALKPGGLLLTDEDLVLLEDAHPPTARILSIPATRIAEEMGKKIIANIVMLGFLTAVGNVVSLAAMEKAVRSSVPPPTVDLNMTAFTKGLEFGRALLQGAAVESR